MNALTLPRTLVGLEYRAVRYPAQLLETKVVALRLPDDHPFRLGYERILGNLDLTAGKLLADPALTNRGRALTRRVDVLTTAIALEEKANERRSAADAELRAEQQRAQQEKDQIQAEHEREAARLKAEREAEAVALERKAAARQRADDKAIVDSTQAIIAAERDRLDAEKARIEARVAIQTAAPKAQLSAANKSVQAAAKLRADADQLEDVRAATKQAGRSD